ncbi:unnamed protein product [Rotaria magnacalcarata]|uniref:Uncharacterized protein n=1 Tax=Rotaria magnacalcarata TaxID=392030 RepID=A0A816VYN4_9BILA|nr:unnamed protein product [Rotaria magnacalcarata]CAF2133704.1 unnamed protein product [Rotaria magnacalcarata]CAF3826210.1 unnamed protein product [Rotaria magnacalcarata]CAF3904135.1 unnamed protein product [Rotaria magnacalcarata]
MDGQRQQKQKHKHRTRYIISFTQGVSTILFLLAVAIVIYLTVLYGARVVPPTNYAIVFDAGSSHTEMFVYHWPADKSEGAGTTSSVNEYFVCSLVAVNINDSTKFNETKAIKAISDFEQHLHLLPGFFEPCLKKAVEKIPSNRHKYSPIFLGATAGMRLARLHNVEQANQILEAIRETFSNYPFQFVVARQVRILTGMEEAIDGWITTNILLEKFKHRHENRKKSRQIISPAELDQDMTGVLDLGGASTQVTFTYVEERGSQPIPLEFTTNITLFDTVYKPYAHSYLCWGKNEATKRYRARLVLDLLNNIIKSSNLSTTLFVPDPCLVRGANDTWKVNKLFTSTCTNNEKLKFANYNTSISSFTFVGAGNASRCNQSLSRLFNSKRSNRSINCLHKKDYCTFDLTFQPVIPENIKFIGLSGYYYVFDNLAHGVPTINKSNGYKLADFHREELERRRKAVCDIDYEKLRIQESITSGNEPYKRALCFDAWYVWLLLTKGIGFKEAELKRVSVVNKFTSGKVGWTLGYMINQTNYIPAEFREKSMGKSGFISWITVSSMIALTTFIFLILTCQACIRRACHKQAHHARTMNNDGYTQPHEQSLA